MQSISVRTTASGVLRVRRMSLGWWKGCSTTILTCDIARLRTQTEMVRDTGGIFGAPSSYLTQCSPKPWAWPIDPKGLRLVCNFLTDMYHMPLFVGENGIGLDEAQVKGEVIRDPFRRTYVREHLAQLNEAVEDCCDMMGYLYRGPIDVVSAGAGEMR